MTKAQKLAVSRRALIQRINRKLAPEEVLKTARNERARQEVGDHYVINVRQNIIVDKHVDLADLAKEYGVLAAWEKLED